MKKAAFLIDGFNFYYSILDLQHLKHCGTKWLNVQALCETLSKTSPINADSIEVHYFSAIPTHFQNTDPGKIQRHKNYLNALRSFGVNVVLGRFKKKWPKCKKCHQKYLSHEEKETDVSLAIKLLELCYEKDLDVIVIISGDTDFSPAVRYCLARFPNIKILFAFPFNKDHDELKQICPQSFTIFKQNYKRHTLPDPVRAPDGKVIIKPREW